MPLLVYRRLGATPPPERDLLTVEADGSFRAWRSLGAVVGHLAGAVDDVTTLTELVAAASEATPPEPPASLPSGASTEEVEAGAAVATVEADEEPPGPWGDLVAAGRAVARASVEQPLAAIALVAGDGPGRWRLEHRGSEPLTIRLGAGSLLLTLWRDGAQAGAAGTNGLGADPVEAGPGWAIDVEVPNAPEGPGTLTASASFVAEDDGVMVPVVASTYVIL